MRTTADRIRHAILFEILGLALVTPLGALVFAMPMHDIGLVSLISAVIALVWNYVFNLLFDRALQRMLGHTRKTIGHRVLHALLFELGLLAMLMPFIALYLGIGLWQALVMDISFAGFYMVYAFGFNWAYDVVFPAPLSKASAAHS